MASGTGTATLDFGSHPGSNEAMVVVTGLATMGASAVAEAYFMRSSTGTHTTNDHAYAALLVGLSCGDVIAATGFTIKGVSEEKLTGQFIVQYVWTD